jgi:hypothetical protein
MANYTGPGPGNVGPVAGFLPQQPGGYPLGAWEHSENLLDLAPTPGPPIPPRRPITPQANLYASPAGPAQPQPQPLPQGQFTLWDALRSLFSGGQQAQAPGAPQGMTGMLNSAPGSFANANPSNRYG